jgi:ADP-ribosylglycohydrolase
MLQLASGFALAVNLGEDADTTGAVYGQLAGGHYGMAAIPPEWRNQLYDGESIIDLTTELYDRSMLRQRTDQRARVGDSTGTSEEGG